MKKLYFLFSLLTLFVFKTFAQPAAGPTAPIARPASSVISIYGAAYTNHAGTDFNPNWGQTGFGSASEVTISGEKMRKYPNLNYQGMDFNGGINVSTMDSVHFDVWSPDITVFDIYLIAGNNGGEKKMSVNLTNNVWNSVSIPLSAYSSQGLALTNIIQFKFVSNTPNAGTTVYLDNIYFWTNNVVPTITGFTVPSGKMVGDAPFILNDPNSNSNGSFSYTSSNTNVATISGNTVTIVGAGTSTITATQAPSGSYGAGSANATLTVGYTPPATDAPDPVDIQADVISLLSKKFTNVPVDHWNASWENATFTADTINSNPTKLYTNLIFTGTEFTGANAIDATQMNYFHVSIWSPNTTPIKVKLVDFGANNAYGGGDDATSIEYVIDSFPVASTWKSYEIPMSKFTGLTTRAHLSQLLFVGNSTTAYFENIYFSKLSTLPVTLSDFKAAKNGASALLTWKTSTEVNNKGFEVQRSSNGTDWNDLTFVSGKGNSSATNSYSATDKNPASGVNYYRLKQLDLDGNGTFSSTVSLNFTGLNSVGFSFYPNPAKNKINVELNTINNNNATLDLVSLDGKVIRTLSVSKQNSNSSVQLNLESVAKGLYIIRLNDGDTIKTSKVLVN